MALIVFDGARVQLSARGDLLAALGCAAILVGIILADRAH